MLCSSTVDMFGMGFAVSTHDGEGRIVVEDCIEEQVDESCLI